MANNSDSQGQPPFDSRTNPKSVLIAGCGYLGGRVAERWAERGVSVHAITRSLQKADWLKARNIIPLVHDLACADDCWQPPAADTVLWSVGFDRTPGVTRRAIWIDGLRRLIHALPESSEPRKFIYISSTSVYGEVNGDSVDEHSVPCPQTEGGQACWQAEQLLTQLLNEVSPSTQSVILRMAGIYGPDRLLRRAADLQARIPIQAAPDDWLNLIHVNDAAHVIDVVSTAAAGIPHVINVVNTGTLTRREYYNRLAELFQSPSPIFADDHFVQIEPTSAADNDARRSRGGNKRVVSEHCRLIPVRYQFDDVRAGLEHAVRNSAQR